MAEVKLYNLTGKEVGVLPLPDALFAVSSRASLVHEAITIQNANSRENVAHTKDRGEVRGGGKKPWKQKGTGRARHGSSRSPIWVGGGVTHGPRNERNFSVKMNKSAKRLALAMVLSDRVRGGNFIALEDLALPETKTSAVAALRAALPHGDKKALVMTTSADVNFVRATRNLPSTKTIAAHSLNVRDLAAAPVVIASKAAIDAIVETMGA